MAWLGPAHVMFIHICERSLVAGLGVVKAEGEGFFGLARTGGITEQANQITSAGVRCPYRRSVKGPSRCQQSCADTHRAYRE